MIYKAIVLLSCCLTNYVRKLNEKILGHLKNPILAS